MFEKTITIRKEYRYFKVKTIERNCFGIQDYITNVYKMFDREKIECIYYTKTYKTEKDAREGHENIVKKISQFEGNYGLFFHKLRIGKVV
jgi:hypothetical protein